MGVLLRPSLRGQGVKIESLFAAVGTEAPG
jgi:hypothetical protein